MEGGGAELVVVYLRQQDRGELWKGPGGSAGPDPAGPGLLQSAPLAPHSRGAHHQRQAITTSEPYWLSQEAGGATCRSCPLFKNGSVIWMLYFKMMIFMFKLIQYLRQFSICGCQTCITSLSRSIHHIFPDKHVYLSANNFRYIQIRSQVSDHGSMVPLYVACFFAFKIGFVN